MTSTSLREKQPRHVMVQFGDGGHTFLLPAGATLMELADRVNDLTAIHDCAPISIEVEVEIDTKNSRRPPVTPSHRAYH